jgi:hypothetical protein
LPHDTASALSGQYDELPADPGCALQLFDGHALG